MAEEPRRAVAAGRRFAVHASWWCSGWMRWEGSMSDRVTVVVDDAQLDRIDELADRLRDAGMQVEQVLGDIGVITGVLPRERRAEVSAVVGVAGVEEERSLSLPPPDADVQ